MMPTGYVGLSAPRAAAHPAARMDGEEPKTPATFGTNIFAGSRFPGTERLAWDHFKLPKCGDRPISDRRAYCLIKRGFDILGASGAILCLWPLIFTIIVVAYLSGGSPLYRHRRVGLGGVFFYCVKFRTMVTDADRVLENLLSLDPQAREEWLRDHKLRDDPRITRFGRVLRRTSLDELPQLWNVLRGDMSLVGPRPVVPEELMRYGKRVPTLLSTRPGITGLWQISGRNNTDYRRRVALDVYYVRSQNVILDWYIMVKTMQVVFTRKGAY